MRLTKKQRERANELAIKKISLGGDLAISGLDEQEELEFESLLETGDLVQLSLYIKAESVAGEQKNPPVNYTHISEFTVLRAKITPQHMLTEGLSVQKDGKKSAAFDMFFDSINSLSSLRGQAITFLCERESLAGSDPSKSRIIVLDSALKFISPVFSKKADQFNLLRDILSQCSQRFRGWQDYINPLAWVNFVISPILRKTELGLSSLSAFFMNPMHKCLKLYNEASNPSPRAAAGFVALGALAAVPYLIGLIPSFVADACRYTRHVWDGFSNLVSSGLAWVGDRINNTNNYKTRFSAASLCLKEIAKNLAYLIPTAIIIGLSCIPGMQFIPAVAKTITAGVSKAAAWTCFGVMASFTSMAAKACSGAIRYAIAVLSPKVIYDKKPGHFPAQTTVKSTSKDSSKTNVSSSDKMINHDLSHTHSSGAKLKKKVSTGSPSLQQDTVAFHANPEDHLDPHHVSVFHHPEEKHSPHEVEPLVPSPKQESKSL